MNDKELKYILAGRHKARTDLRWLCRYILNASSPYHVFSEEVHRPMTSFLQQFDVQGKDKVENGVIEYTPPDTDPAKALAAQKSSDRRRLLLAPRGWFKTSYNVIAHTIQWVLNYPDITILIIHSSGEMAEKMMVQIKAQFQHNPVMRYFFPEFCPPHKAKEWGTQQYFHCPCRKVFTPAPTVGVAGIDSIRTGMHYHVIKFTDIVDKNNSTSKELCRKVIDAYGMARFLLVSPAYWVDVEGTRYSFADLYGRIAEEWILEKRERREHKFKCFVMGCYKKQLTESDEEYSPDELDAPYLMKDEKRISRFPETFSVELLEELEADPVTGGASFAAQMLNNPIADEDQTFDLKDIRWKTEEELKRIPFQYHVTTVDTAETVSKRADFTCITTCGWDRFGRCYVVDVRLGKFQPQETIEHIFGVHQKFKPAKMLIEETGFVRGLQTSFDRVRVMSGVHPNIEHIKRDTKIAKEQRIEGLQPWFKNGMIFLSEGLSVFVKEHVKHELTRFPKYQYDDFLDSLADQFQHKNYFGPTKPPASAREIMERAQNMRLFQAIQRQAIYGSSEDEDTSYDGLGAL